MKVVFFTLLLCYCCLNLKAQQDISYSPEHLYPADTLRKDLAFLKSVLEEAHPSLYRYTPKDSLEKYFAEADGKLTGPMTDVAFWKIAAPLVSAIRSGHTVLMPSNAFVNWCNNQMIDRMPLSVLEKNGHIYAASFPGIPKPLFPGAEIMSIDGHPAAMILAELQKLLPTEGYSEQFHSELMESNYFDRFYGLLWGFKPQYNIIYKDSAGLAQTTILKAKKAIYGTSLDQNKAMRNGKIDDIKESVGVTYCEGLPATAMLKISQFAYVNYYESFDENFFKQLKADKIKHLIIDIRGNGGGSMAIGTDIMQYLIKGFCSQTDGVTARARKFSFASNIIKDGSDDITVFRLINVGHHKYAWKNADGKCYSYPEYNFNQDVYLLVDKGTFSAAALFAANLKSQRKITVLGEETGGGEAGTDGWGFAIVTLPQTHLLLQLPEFWVKSTFEHKNNGHGVIPDIVVSPTIADRVNNNDVVLKKTFEVIRSKTKPN
ncbi:S41 family peptidase [Mucilaginibacter agri]|uniref:Tail specific protease domain-containing protein n=1 Tax=Mucilaginibacter agri TaxID=2695265 RepID=A0A965ZGJ5_9SPHI|nr:S41 family peptidase [Mucilaginibacter agri]NCD69346.1 hypothetical protein [Mucilaginibacter agri]